MPLHTDRKLFEFIVLDTFQSGLSWRLMLEKREGFKQAFANFDPKKVAKFTARDVTRLLNDAGIIRNRQKITATVRNAQAFLAVQKEFGTFATYIWQFTNGKTIDHKLRSEVDYRATSPIAEAMSKEMKSRGFAFVGPTTCHAYMQGIGMYNDHLVSCFRHAEVKSVSTKAGFRHNHVRKKK